MAEDTLQMNSARPAAELRARAGKYLTFTLSDETYGVNIQHVREIIRMTPITAVPCTPPFIKGVINLRGKIIPVVDMRMKFAMGNRDFTRETCIVVLDVAASDGRIWIGAIVDSVSEVLDIKAGEIEAVPSFGIRVNTAFLLGMVRGKENVNLLLDIEKVLSHDEMIVVEAAKSESEESAAAAKESPK